MTATTGDSALSVVAEGRLQILNEAGFLDGSDCVVTARICRQLGEDVAGDAALALAFAVRAVRDGSTALALDSVAALTADVDDDEEDVDSEPPTVGGTVALPEPGPWLDTVRSSALVAAGRAARRSRARVPRPLSRRRAAHRRRVAGAAGGVRTAGRSGSG